MNKQKLIDRVKKLMAMAADGSSPNEAMIAARRARKLMDEHQLSISDLTQRSEFSAKGASESRRFTPHWESIISVAIAKYNDCIATLNFNGCTENGACYELMFKGYDEDVKVAEYMFCYIIENGKRQCSKHMKENGYARYNARVGTSFKDAYGLAIVKKINELIKEREKEMEAVPGTSLMIIKQDLVEQHFGAAKYKTSNRNRDVSSDADQNAHAQGYNAGKNTPINTGIENETESKGYLS